MNLFSKSSRIGRIHLFHSVDNPVTRIRREGQLSKLDWNNVFAAGGSVLAR